MSNRLFRAVQGSGVAFAATAVVLMSFHGQSAGANGGAPSPDVKAIAHGIDRAPEARSGAASGIIAATARPATYHCPVGCAVAATTVLPNTYHNPMPDGPELAAATVLPNTYHNPMPIG